MKFFTRELYEAIQGDVEGALDRWEEARKAYGRHLAGIEAGLPLGMRRLAGRSLHDGQVRAVRRGERELVMEVEDPIGIRGVVRVRFLGAREAEGLEGVVGDYWLYEEVEVVGEGAVEFRVLLQEGEIRVVAEEAEV